MSRMNPGNLMILKILRIQRINHITLIRFLFIFYFLPFNFYLVIS